MLIDVKNYTIKGLLKSDLCRCFHKVVVGFPRLKSINISKA